ncbi:MAG TPA: hypothetical protein VFC46_04620, partial [Humisphaera sp.]|nr:hypothetical protein [Humisphaera sp.]
SKTVGDTLRSRNQNAANPPPNLSFARVTIPSKVKFSIAYPSGLTHEKPAPLLFNPPPPPNSPDNAINPAYTPAVAPPPGAGPAFDPFADTNPLHKGETTRDDSLVTVLAVVMIDPPKPVAKEGASK